MRYATSRGDAAWHRSCAFHVREASQYSYYTHIHITSRSASNVTCSMIPADVRAFIAHDAGTCSPGSPPWTVSRSRTLGAGEWPADRAPALLDLRLNDGGWPAEDIRELEHRFGPVAHAPIPPARLRRPDWEAAPTEAPGPPWRISAPALTGRGPSVRARTPRRVPHPAADTAHRPARQRDDRGSDRPNDEPHQEQRRRARGTGRRRGPRTTGLHGAR